MKKRISRRNFNRNITAAAACGSVLLSRPLAAQEEKPSGAASPHVVVAEGKNPAALVMAALEALGGLQTWVKAGSKVVIKPNIGWDRMPQMAANTNPQIVGKLCSLCKDAGASEVLVFDRTCNEARRCYTNSGIAEAAEANGAKTLYIKGGDSPEFRKVAIPGGVSITEWPLYAKALDADVYINVPVAKHHSLTRLTLGMKNVMGICGGNRGSLHVNIGEKLTDIHRVFKPTLTLVDAYRVLLRNGPSGGNPRDTKLKFTMVGSTDFVAADAYSATLFDLSPQDIPYVTAGERAGLGIADVEKMNIQKVVV
jgi:uncharacterized protein (DUF362 family)